MHVENLLVAQEGEEKKKTDPSSQRRIFKAAADRVKNARKGRTAQPGSCQKWAKKLKQKESEGLVVEMA